MLSERPDCLQTLIFVIWVWAFFIKMYISLDGNLRSGFDSTVTFQFADLKSRAGHHSRIERTKGEENAVSLYFADYSISVP